MEDEDLKKETQNLAYPPAFKLEVALFAKKHSQYAAAKIFNVARRRIFDWMRQIPKLEELIAKGHMKKMTGRGPKNRDIDQALYTWYCDRSVTFGLSLSHSLEFLNIIWKGKFQLRRITTNCRVIESTYMPLEHC